MTKEHTPTPWKIIDYVNDISKPSVRIVGENEDTIADNEPYYPQPITPENAAYIVKCVNMHDELVEDLRLLLSSSYDYQTGVAEAEETLKKAGAL